MSLLVWLPFNGNINNQGTLGCNFSGTSSYYNEGKIGQCIDFGSYSNRLTSATKVTLGNKVTISFWIKIKSWYDWARVFCFYSDNDDSFHSCLNTSSQGTIGTQLNVAGTKIHDSYAGNLSDLQWHHFACVVDSDTKKHYLDGNLIGTWNISSMPINMEYTLVIGAGGDEYQPSKMYMNDFRIYDHALSSKEVKEISKGLMLHYPLTNNGQGGINIARQTNTESTRNIFYYAEQVGGSTREIIYEDGIPCVKITRTEAQHSGWQYLAYENIQLNMLEAGKWYTVSFDVKTSMNASINLLGILRGNATGWLSSTNIDVNSTTIANEWVHIVWNTKMIDSFDGATIDSQIIYLRADWLNNPNTWIMMKNMKMEEGLIDTPWSPNPSDAAYNQMGYGDSIEYDVSGNGYNGIKTNTSSISDTIKYNSSTIFNGTDAYISAPSMTLNMSNITFSFWCKWSEFKSYSRIFDFSQNTSKTERNGFSLVCCNEWTTGTLYINGVNTENEIFFPVTTSNVVLNTWYHVVITISNTTGKVYINNELVATVQTLNIGYVSSNYNYLGKSNYPNDSLLKGNISDFRIYATALSAEDIKELYSQSAFIDNKGNIGCYEFIET